MCEDYLLDKSEPDAVAARLGGEERNEYSIEVFRWDAASCITDPDVCVAAIRGAGDCSGDDDQF